MKLKMPWILPCDYMPELKLHSIANRKIKLLFLKAGENYKVASYVFKPNTNIQYSNVLYMENHIYDSLVFPPDTALPSHIIRDLLHYPEFRLKKISSQIDIFYRFIWELNKFELTGKFVLPK